MNYNQSWGVYEQLDPQLFVFVGVELRRPPLEQVPKFQNRQRQCRWLLGLLEIFLPTALLEKLSPHLPELHKANG